jgi:hypothetical protein
LEGSIIGSQIFFGLEKIARAVAEFVIRDDDAGTARFDS